MEDSNTEGKLYLNICKKHYPEEFKRYCVEKKLNTKNLQNTINSAVSFINQLERPVRKKIEENIRLNRLNKLYKEYLELNRGV